MLAAGERAADAGKIESVAPRLVSASRKSGRRKARSSELRLGRFRPATRPCNRERLGRKAQAAGAGAAHLPCRCSRSLAPAETPPLEHPH
jgi:hypothetical protein